MHRHTIALALTLTMVSGLLAEPAAKQGDVPGEAANAQPAKVEPLKVTVVSATGPAQKRHLNGQDKWVPLEAGQQLDRLTVIRTGFGAKVVLKFEDRGMVTVRSATKIGLGELHKQGDKATVKLGLKYGTVRAEVERGHGPNDVSIATPVAVASVRGTVGSVGYSGDMGMGVDGHSGTWNVASRRRSRKVRRGETTDGNLTPPSQIALNKRDTRMGDIFGGLTPTERHNLRDNGGGRGIIGFTGGAPGLVLSQPRPKPRSPNYEY